MQEQKNAAYEKNLTAIELDSDSYQNDFVYGGETIALMRVCLLAEQLYPGKKVLFIPNGPTAVGGGFAYELGIITDIDKNEKIFTAQCDSAQLLEGSLRYVLARHDSAATGIHFGQQCTQPLLGLHDMMARDFLSMAKEEWQQTQEQTPAMAMTM